MIRSKSFSPAKLEDCFTSFPLYEAKVTKVLLGLILFTNTLPDIQPLYHIDINKIKLEF